MMIVAKPLPPYSLWVATLTAGIFCLPSYAAENETPKANATFLDQLIINASPVSQTNQQSDSAITSLSYDQLATENATSVSDIFRYTPSVSVSGGAQGDGLITIRGISGNRVLIAVDGVKQAKNLSWSSLNSSRNLIDINALKQVEVISGPASASFGSDALGGLVYYTTKDPSDFLDNPSNTANQSTAGQYRVIYNGANKGLSNSISLAGRNDSLEGMLIYTYEDASEKQTPVDDSAQGSARRSTDPKDTQNESVLAKLKYQLDEHQAVKISAEHLSSDDDTQVLSSNSQDEQFLDIERRQRLSAEYTNDKATRFYDELTVTVDWQKTTNDQTQKFYNAGAPYFGDYVYDADYDETTRDLKLSLQKDLDFSTTAHQVSYGLSYEQTLFEQQRTSSLSGTNRSMPRAESKLVGIWAQDLIEWYDSGLRVTPGIRYDAYTVDAQPDAAYLVSNPIELDPGTNTDQKISLKLGVNYPITDAVTVFGQFAQGFKTPDMDQLFANYGRTGAYQFIANSNLKPESSNSLEFGFRYNHAGISGEVVAFYNDYKNFIDETIDYSNPSYPYGIYQQTNLKGAVIKGVEFKTQWDLGMTQQALRGLSLNASLAYATGTYDESGESQPIDSVSPLSGVLGLHYDHPNQQWGSSVIVTAAKGKSANDVSDSATFRPAGYGVIDLAGYYQWTPSVRIDAGVYNLSDKTYWQWDTARDHTQSTSGLERFAESGRHLRLGLTYNF
ncbi:TonB-dependent hemoglobin/transferrin/lactoferrin family receptor [Neptunomonas phycophila]|uniref:TonB-dependent hemoglobin/transferrin/lactoferrin family receptor n=1 Tax=Neptunomonas phycophila TaxID=1572645 RepID=UPI00373551EE